LVFRKGVRGTVIWSLPQHIDGVFSNHVRCPIFLYNSGQGGGDVGLVPPAG
jgi:hypothetical protein